MTGRRRNELPSSSSSSSRPRNPPQQQYSLTRGRQQRDDGRRGGRLPPFPTPNTKFGEGEVGEVQRWDPKLESYCMYRKDSTVLGHIGIDPPHTPDLKSQNYMTPLHSCNGYSHTGRSFQNFTFFGKIKTGAVGEASKKLDELASSLSQYKQTKKKSKQKKEECTIRRQYVTFPTTDIHKSKTKWLQDLAGTEKLSKLVNGVLPLDQNQCQILIEHQVPWHRASWWLKIILLNEIANRKHQSSFKESELTGMLLGSMRNFVREETTKLYAKQALNMSEAQQKERATAVFEKFYYFKQLIEWVANDGLLAPDRLLRQLVKQIELITKPPERERGERGRGVPPHRPDGVNNYHDLLINLYCLFPFLSALTNYPVLLYELVRICKKNMQELFTQEPLLCPVWGGAGGGKEEGGEGGEDVDMFSFFMDEDEEEGDDEGEDEEEEGAEGEVMEVDEDSKQQPPQQQQQQQQQPQPQSQPPQQQSQYSQRQYHPLSPTGRERAGGGGVAGSPSGFVFSPPPNPLLDEEAKVSSVTTAQHTCWGLMCDIIRFAFSVDPRHVAICFPSPPLRHILSHSLPSFSSSSFVYRCSLVHTYVPDLSKLLFVDGGGGRGVGEGAGIGEEEGVIDQLRIEQAVRSHLSSLPPPPPPTPPHRTLFFTELNTYPPLTGRQKTSFGDDPPNNMCDDPLSSSDFELFFGRLVELCGSFVCRGGGWGGGVRQFVRMFVNFVCEWAVMPNPGCYAPKGVAKEIFSKNQHPYLAAVILYKFEKYLVATEGLKGQKRRGVGGSGGGAGGSNSSSSSSTRLSSSSSSSRLSSSLTPNPSSFPSTTASSPSSFNPLPSTTTPHPHTAPWSPPPSSCSPSFSPSYTESPHPLTYSLTTPYSATSPYPPTSPFPIPPNTKPPLRKGGGGGGGGEGGGGGGRGGGGGGGGRGGRGKRRGRYGVMVQNELHFFLDHGFFRAMKGEEERQKGRSGRAGEEEGSYFSEVRDRTCRLFRELSRLFLFDYGDYMRYLIARGVVSSSITSLSPNQFGWCCTELSSSPPSSSSFLSFSSEDEDEDEDKDEDEEKENKQHQDLSLETINSSCFECLNCQKRQHLLNLLDFCFPAYAIQAQKEEEKGGVGGGGRGLLALLSQRERILGACTVTKKKHDFQRFGFCEAKNLMFSYLLGGGEGGKGEEREVSSSFVEIELHHSSDPSNNPTRLFSILARLSNRYSEQLSLWLFSHLKKWIQTWFSRAPSHPTPLSPSSSSPPPEPSSSSPPPPPHNKEGCQFDTPCSPCPLSSSYDSSLSSSLSSSLLFSTPLPSERSCFAHSCSLCSSSFLFSSPSLSVLKRGVGVLFKCGGAYMVLDLIMCLLEILPVVRGERERRERDPTGLQFLLFCINSLLELEWLIIAQNRLLPVLRQLILKHQHLCSLPSQTALPSHIPTDPHHLGGWLIHTPPGGLCLRFLFSHPSHHSQLLDSSSSPLPDGEFCDSLGKSFWGVVSSSFSSFPSLSPFLVEEELKKIQENSVENLVSQGPLIEVGLHLFLKGIAEYLFPSTTTTPVSTPTTPNSRKRKNQDTEFVPRKRQKESFPSSPSFSSSSSSSSSSSFSCPSFNLKKEYEREWEGWGEEQWEGEGREGKIRELCKEIQKVLCFISPTWIPQALLRSLPTYFTPFLLSNLSNSSSSSPLSFSELLSPLFLMIRTLISLKIIDLWDLFSLFLFPLIRSSALHHSPPLAHHLSLLFKTPLSLHSPSIPLSIHLSSSPLPSSPSAPPPPPSSLFAFHTLQALLSLYLPACQTSLSSPFLPSSSPFSIPCCNGVPSSLAPLWLSLSRSLGQLMEGNIDDLGGLILQSGNPLPLIFVLFDVFGGSPPYKCICRWLAPLPTQINRLFREVVRRGGEGGGHVLGGKIISLYFQYLNMERGNLPPLSLCHHHLSRSIGGGEKGAGGGGGIESYAVFFLRNVFHQILGSILSPHLEGQDGGKGGRGGEGEEERFHVWAASFFSSLQPWGVMCGSAVLHWLKDFLYVTFHPPSSSSSSSFRQNLQNPPSFSLPPSFSPSFPYPLSTPLLVLFSHGQEICEDDCFCHKVDFSTIDPLQLPLERQLQATLLETLLPIIELFPSTFRNDKHLPKLIIDHILKFVGPLEEEVFPGLKNSTPSPRGGGGGKEGEENRGGGGVFFKCALFFRLRIVSVFVPFLFGEEQKTTLVTCFVRLFAVVVSQPSCPEDEPIISLLLHMLEKLLLEKGATKRQAAFKQDVKRFCFERVQFPPSAQYTLLGRFPFLGIPPPNPPLPSQISVVNLHLSGKNVKEVRVGLGLVEGFQSDRYLVCPTHFGGRRRRHALGQLTYEP